MWNIDCILKLSSIGLFPRWFTLDEPIFCNNLQCEPINRVQLLTICTSNDFLQRCRTVLIILLLLHRRKVELNLPPCFRFVATLTCEIWVCSCRTSEQTYSIQRDRLRAGLSTRLTRLQPRAPTAARGPQFAGAPRELRESYSAERTFNPAILKLVMFYCSKCRTK